MIFFLFLLFLLNSQCIVCLSFPPAASADETDEQQPGKNTRQRTPAFLLLDSIRPGCWKSPISGSSAPSRQFVLQSCCSGVVYALWNATWERLHISNPSHLFQSTEVYGGFLDGYPSYLSILEADHTQSPIITLPTNISTGSAANPKPTSETQDNQVLLLPTRHRVYTHIMHVTHTAIYLRISTLLWPTSGERKNSHCTFCVSTRKNQIMCAWY